MDDAAVVAGLVRGDVVFLLHHRQLHGREAPRNFQSGSQSDNAGADNKQICSAVRHA